MLFVAGACTRYAPPATPPKAKVVASKSTSLPAEEPAEAPPCPGSPVLPMTGPSFSCAKARGIQQIICRDPDLVDTDRRIFGALGLLRCRLLKEEFAKIQAEQAAWEKSHGGICTGRDEQVRQCLLKRSGKRWSALASLVVESER